MSLIHETLTVTVGYRFRCGCGSVSPLGDTEQDAQERAEAAGWEVNSPLSGLVADFCPHCYERREADYDRRFGPQETDP